MADIVRVLRGAYPGPAIEPDATIRGQLALLGQIGVRYGGAVGRSSRIGPLAMPIISRGKPVEDSGGFGFAYAAANAVDADYSTTWRSINIPSVGSPQRIAVDLSSVANASKTSALLVWFNNTGGYWLTDAQTSSNYSLEPRDYTIQAHTGAGGGAAPAINDAGWTTVATETGNTKHSKQYAMNLSGKNWLQIRVTACNGAAGVNDDCSLQFDVYDISGGNQDNWIFLGDSITQECFGQKNIDGSAWTNGPIQTLINTAKPAQYPLMENGGVATQRSDWCDTNKATLLSGFTGKYVGIAFGSNDASVPTVAATFYTTMLSVVDYVIGLGKIPVIPKIPKRTLDATADGFVVQYNAQIDNLYAARTSIVRGPDLYAKVADGTIPLRDGLHPTFSGAGNGYEQMLTVWRDALLATVY